MATLFELLPVAQIFVCYTSRVIKTMTNDDPLTSVDLLDDGSTLAVGSSRGRVYIFDIRLATVPLQTFVAHQSSVNKVCFQKNPVLFKAGFKFSKELKCKVLLFISSFHYYVACTLVLSCYLHFLIRRV